MTPDYDWSLSRTFLAVVRTGSFSGAARTLMQAPPTVRRQIEHLEKAIGTTLFTRSQGGVRTTPLAERLVFYAERIEASANAFIRAAEQDRFSGVVRIAADEMIGTRMLPSILALLRLDHPELRFELVLTRTAPGMIRRSVDLSLSLIRPMEEGAIVSRIATMETGLYGERSLVAQHGGLLRRANLLEPGTLVGGLADTHLADLIGEPGGSVRPDAFALSTDDQGRRLRRGARRRGLRAPAHGLRRTGRASRPSASRYHLDDGHLDDYPSRSERRTANQARHRSAS